MRDPFQSKNNIKETYTFVLDLGSGSFKYQVFANNTNKMFNILPYQTLFNMHINFLGEKGKTN